MTKKSKTVQTLRKNKTTLMNKAGEIHDKVLMIADEMVDISVDTGSKYQRIADRAIKKSQPLMTKQMDIVLDSIEEMKAQYSKGNKRFLKLLGLDKATKELSKKFNKTYKSTKKQITETVQDIEGVIGNPVSDVKKMSANASKSVKKFSKKIGDIKVTKLTSIKGIGPKLEKILNEEGIKDLNDLVKSDIKTIRNILAKAGPRFSSYNPAEWLKEARKAMK